MNTLLGLQEWLPEVVNWPEILAAAWSGIRRLPGNCGIQKLPAIASQTSWLDTRIKLQKNPTCSPPPRPKSSLSAASKTRAEWLLSPSGSHVIASVWWVLIPELLLQGNVGKHVDKFSSLCTAGRHTGGELEWMLIANPPLPSHSLKKRKRVTGWETHAVSFSSWCYLIFV